MNQKTNTQKKVYCAAGCKLILTAPESFPKGSYCAIYCCACCPDKNRSPCQKEVRDGTILENLRKVVK